MEILNYINGEWTQPVAGVPFLFMDKMNVSLIVCFGKPRL